MVVAQYTGQCKVFSVSILGYVLCRLDEMILIVMLDLVFRGLWHIFDAQFESSPGSCETSGH